MPVVLDASIVLDWALGEGNPAAVAAVAAARERMRADSAVAPSLLWFEIWNGLIIAERQGRSTPDYAASFLRELARFPLRADAATDPSVVMALARRHRLTIYDSAYLELALRNRLPLATLDGDLIKAAPAEGAILLT